MKKANKRPGGDAAKRAATKSTPAAGAPALADDVTLLSDLQTLVRSARQRLATAANATYTLLCLSLIHI